MFKHRVITSTSNTFIKKLTALGQKKRRDETKCFIVEGESFVKSIPPSWEIRHIVLAESYAKASEDIPPDAVIIADSLFKKISDAVSPQGILAVCVQKHPTLDACLNGSGFLLFAEKLTDPGNVGAVIRTAAAAGCGGVLLSQGSADAYSPKVLRSSAGAFFCVPVVEGVETEAALCAIGQKGYSRIATHPHGGDYPYKLDFKQKCCILIGNESAGLSEIALSLCDHTVKIPMASGVESLNAAVSAGILMYEIVRQNLHKNEVIL
jgi:TrmH family RNA methyltransferase